VPFDTFASFDRNSSDARNPTTRSIAIRILLVKSAPFFVRLVVTDV
jgi:hypothetical protein